MLSLAVVGVVLTAGLVLASASRATVLTARGQAVADLAALAGAVGGEGSAREVALANGATSVDSSADGPITVVELRYRGHLATAAAELCVVDAGPARSYGVRRGLTGPGCR